MPTLCFIVVQILTQWERGDPYYEVLTVTQCKAHGSQFEHSGDSLKTPVAPLIMSPSPVCALSNTFVNLLKAPFEGICGGIKKGW